MREWVAPAPADILVSERHGSWGDNEPRPTECLDGAQRFLRPGTISIPCDYTSFVAPLSSHKLWNEVKTFKDLAHFETAYVVKVPSPRLPARRGAARLPPSTRMPRRRPTTERLTAASRSRRSSAASPRRRRRRLLPLDAVRGGVHLDRAVDRLRGDVLVVPALRAAAPPPPSPTALAEAHFWRHASHHKVWYEWALTRRRRARSTTPTGAATSSGCGIKLLTPPPEIGRCELRSRRAPPTRRPAGRARRRRRRHPRKPADDGARSPPRRRALTRAGARRPRRRRPRRKPRGRSPFLVARSPPAE